ncbi:putative RNA-binding Zn ribbon-like protein [Kribbella amoyensis]|uniref:Putative RNA-binding Zn ribbon-like protein n=1 Tax=Kribbella amoyensis TaxID=996641 RepID=A0A561BU44_9ACTN|nr:CGNR zinc finger domain-containing protein [Kribbella amoyensis]TWD82377.1 putative RNA-binding Zn ribbon-like protein [Kribbella amoyensis]
MEHRFPCGNTALDFVGTLRARRNAAPLEKLGSPESLQAWFRESGVVVGTETTCVPPDVAKAVTLREAIYALIWSRLHQEPYDELSLAVVNTAARSPAAIPQLTRTGHRIEATADQALSTIARDAITILGGSDADLLKECGRPECTQVYLDRSRGGRREWCAMETCGNKMKAKAYRARKKDQTRPLSPRP